MRLFHKFLTGTLTVETCRKLLQKKPSKLNVSSLISNVVGLPLNNVTFTRDGNFWQNFASYSVEIGIFKFRLTIFCLQA